MWMKKKLVACGFLMQQPMIEFQSMNDYWNFPLEGRLRTLGVQCGALPRLPWEVVCFGVHDPLPGVPLAVRLDASCVQDSKDSRDAVLEAFAKYKTRLTFAEMKKIVNTQCEAVGNSDRWWSLEKTFLDTIAEDLVSTRVRARVLELFPKDCSEHEAKTYKTIVDGLESLGTSLDVQTVGGDLFDDIQAVQSFVENLQKSVAPTEARIKRMNDWFKSVLLAAENLCVANFPGKATKGKPGPEIMICGREAFARKWQAFAAAPESSKAKLTEDMRRFYWLLTPEQKAEVDLNVKKTVKLARANSLNTKAIMDACDGPAAKSAKKGDIVPAGVATSTSSGSSDFWAGGAAAGASASAGASSATGSATKGIAAKMAQKAALVALLAKTKASSKGK